MNYYLIVIPESQKIQTKREGGISIIIDLILNSFERKDELICDVTADFTLNSLILFIRKKIIIIN